MTGVGCVYLSAASVLLVTRCIRIIRHTKICNSACFRSVDVAELQHKASLSVREIVIFGRPVILKGKGFNLFLKDSDSAKYIEKLFDK